MEASFNAHPWLRNKHLQTCIPTLIARTKPLLPFVVEPVPLPDGDVIEFGRVGSWQAPAILLMPGLEGDLTSPYIQQASRALCSSGWQVLVMHYRTCGSTINNQAKSYNAYCTQDLDYLLGYLQQHFALQPSLAIGFSMGGNLLLHYVHQHPNYFKAIITASTPFDMHAAVKHLPRFYEKRFLKKFKRKLRDKIAAGVDMPCSLAQIRQLKTLRDYDEVCTVSLYGHQSVDDYYAYSSCIRFLADIATPTHMIFAADDPFIPACSIPQTVYSPHVTLEMHQKGGHVGFITQKQTTKASRYWLADRLVKLASEFS